MNDFVWEIGSRLVVLALLVWGMLSARKALRRMSDRRGRLPAVIDPKNPTQPIPGSEKLEGAFEGVEYQSEYNPGTETSPPFMVLSVLEPSDGDFMVVKHQVAGCLGRLLKRWGVTFVKTRDEAFDDRYDVVTERTPGFAAACFRDDGHRQAVDGLFDLGATAVRNDGKGLDAIHTSFEREMDDDSSFIHQAMTHLGTLSAGCTQIAGRRCLGVQADRLKWIAAMAVPIAVMVLMFAVGNVSSHLVGPRQVDGDNAFGRLAVKLVAAPLFIWLPLSFWLVKGKSRSAEFLGVVWAVSIIAFYFCASMLVFDLNALLDRGPTTNRIQAVIALSANDTATGYQIQVPSWRENTAWQTIFVPRKRYEQNQLAFEQTEALKITTRPGFFGFEWISSFEPLPAEFDWADQIGPDEP